MSENQMVTKTFRVEVKEVDVDNGIVDMLIPVSTGSVDRDGEVIEPSAWKSTLPAFRKRPVLLSSHDYRDLRKQIGEFVKLKITDDGLMAQPKYYINEGNEEADWAFKLAAKNRAAFSVGFIPKDWEDGDGDKAPRRTYKDVELLEISQVVVPANRDAIQSVRSKAADPVICELCDEILDEDEQKVEVTENYIRIPVPGEEGKHEEHKIRTIDISKNEGIKALYCVDCKKIITYLFAKDKWTVDEARQWVDEHKDGIATYLSINSKWDIEEISEGLINTIYEIDKQISYKCECIECGYKFESKKHCADVKCPECGGECRRAERPGPGRAIDEQDIEWKGAIPYRKTPLADPDAEWDAAKEVRQADVEDLKIMCAWVGDDPDLKTSYKLPHHRASGRHECVWRGVAAAGGVVMGTRGGAAIPEADLAGVKAHLAKHYKEFGKTAPWEKQVAQAEIIDELDYLIRLLDTKGLHHEAIDDAWELMRRLMRLTGDDIPDDICQKVGAVLNQKNRERLNQIKTLAQEVLDSAERVEPEDDKATEPEITMDEIIDIVKETVKDVIGKAQGKVG